MFLSGLYIYPIKSLKGISLDKCKVEKRGFQYDRRWMLIDSNNNFMTQREYPKLATFSVAVQDAGLKVSAAGNESHVIPFQSKSDAPIEVRVWKDTCQGALVGGETDEWFSEALGEACRLVHMPDYSNRSVNPQYGSADDIVSFADAYPFLLLTEASLDDLNQRLAEPVSMNRFRPNLVVSGAGAFAEDSWKTVTIGRAVFNVAKPCVRCVMPNVDQERGVRAGDEPLRTLTTFRRWGNEVRFGQNLIAISTGETVRVGDELVVNGKEM